MPPGSSPRSFFALASVLIVSILATGWDAPARAQQPPPPTQQRRGGATITTNVDLVVLHATVQDQRGHVVTSLKQENFRVFEDKVEQQLAVFRREDVPISVGLVIDNSGSMRERRDRVNSAALTFVKTSNPQDEAFVVNFNDEYYLDLDKDFTSDIEELKEALERIDSRGGTALYDAVIGSLDHVKKGKHNKKVLLVVTDGEDNMSRVGGGDSKKALERTLLEAQKSDAVIYTIGLIGKSKEGRRAREALLKLSKATGGMAFFPEGLQDVEPICTQIAHDIRSQYLLAYYPSNPRRDGTFRSVAVEAVPPKGVGKVSVRTRPGYYAKLPSTGTGGQ